MKSPLRSCVGFVFLGTCLTIAQTASVKPADQNVSNKAAQAPNQQSSDVAAGSVCDQQFAAQTGSVYRGDQGIIPARPVRTPDPKYPKTAVKLKKQGAVVLCFIVDPEGKVGDVGVSRSLSSDLDEAARDTVRSWRFVPATKDGQPVASQVWTTVWFKIRG